VPDPALRVSNAAAYFMHIVHLYMHLWKALAPYATRFETAEQALPPHHGNASGALVIGPRDHFKSAEQTLCSSCLQPHGLTFWFGSVDIRDGLLAALPPY